MRHGRMRRRGSACWLHRHGNNSRRNRRDHDHQQRDGGPRERDLHLGPALRAQPRAGVHEDQQPDGNPQAAQEQADQRVDEMVGRVPLNQNPTLAVRAKALGVL